MEMKKGPAVQAGPSVGCYTDASWLDNRVWGIKSMRGYCRISELLSIPATFRHIYTSFQPRLHCELNRYPDRSRGCNEVLRFQFDIAFKISR